MIDYMEKSLSKLGLDERRALEAAIGPEADALLQKAFGTKVMELFSGKRRGGMEKPMMGGDMMDEGMMGGPMMGGKMDEMKKGLKPKGAKVKLRSMK